mmetsp:Transcript_52750/g.123374  ORF Transcript_52750/g.123374 Transcript_52750/m.123374 type:complete len:231 (-) Transcript_52750:183-875(-)
MFLFLIGPSGSGKTTLAEDLLQEEEVKTHFTKVARIEEVARTIMRKEGISGQALKDRMVSDPDFYVQFQCDIVQEHCKQEQAQEEEDCLVLSDRSVLDTIPFVHEYLLEERRGDAEARIRKLEEFQECLQRYRLPTSMVVLVHPFAAEAPADGTRLIPKDGSGAAFTKRLRQLLQDEHIAYVDLVETDRKGRVREILKELEAMRKYHAAEVQFPAVPPFPIQQSKHGMGV